MATVFRAADAASREQAETISEYLRQNGLDATLMGDDAPGVVVGTWEVRVPASDAARADEWLAASGLLEERVETAAPAQGDASHDFDLVTIFSAEAAEAEMEALSIKALLEANEIPVVMVGTPQIPSLRFSLQVPRSRAEDAAQVVREAQLAGPQAAEEAEAETEAG